MHPEVRKLLDVQKVDNKLIKLQRACDSIPKEREKREAGLQKIQKGLDEVLAVQQAAELEQRNAELSIKQADDELKQLETRLNQVKNNAEYQATLLQMESVKKDRAANEDRGLELIDQIDAAKARVAEVQAKFDEEKKVFDEFVREGEQFLADKREELESLKAQKSAVFDGVHPEVRDRYTRVVNARDGVAVVPVEGETCTGCYVSIPPNMLVKVMSGGSVVQCNMCQRILYVAE
ncbi:MAG: C4-type zinc ribbon domain-containing protein [Planctomycetota bacterium]